MCWDDPRHMSSCGEGRCWDVRGRWRTRALVHGSSWRRLEAFEGLARFFADGPPARHRRDIHRGQAL